MDHNSEDKLAREAKAIVALVLRNGPIEDVHAGKLCPTCGSQPGYSRITDGEMRQIMKHAVDRVYALLRLKIEHPEEYESQIRLGALFATAWDAPTSSPDVFFIPEGERDLSEQEMTKLVGKRAPSWKKACDQRNIDNIVLHQMAFGRSVNEVFLLGLVIKYAGIAGKHVMIGTKKLGE